MPVMAHFPDESVVVDAVAEVLAVLSSAPVATVKASTVAPFMPIPAFVNSCPTRSTVIGFS